MKNSSSLLKCTKTVNYKSIYVSSDRFKVNYKYSKYQLLDNLGINTSSL